MSERFKIITTGLNLYIIDNQKTTNELEPYTVVSFKPSQIQEAKNVGVLLNEMDKQIKVQGKVNSQQEVEYQEQYQEIKELKKEIGRLNIQINSLKLHIDKLVDGSEISQLLMKEYERSDKLEEENEKLKRDLRKIPKSIREVWIE